MKPELYDELNPIVQGNRLKRLYVHAFRELMQRENLSRNELLVLLFLASNQSSTQRRISWSCEALPKAMYANRWMNFRVEACWRARPIPTIARRMQLFPTPAAQGIITEGLAIQRRFFEMLYEGVTEEENETLKRVFEKIWRNARSAMQDDR